MISKATVGRLPEYLSFLREVNCQGQEFISATNISKALGYGEVQVRKDLGAVSCGGKPKKGHSIQGLIKDIEGILSSDKKSKAVIVGAGKLGKALLGFNGFESFGIEIAAAFDCDPKRMGTTTENKKILPMSDFKDFCKQNGVQIGIITAPSKAAQEICDEMIKCGINAIWNFASQKLRVPPHVVVKNENLALSLAMLNLHSCDDSQVINI